MILKFSEDEDPLIDRILSMLPGKIEKRAAFSSLRNAWAYRHLEIDRECRIVRIMGTEVDMTSTEFDILSFLAERPGQVFSREQIYEHIWKEPCLGCDKIIATHIRHIREKIETDPARPIYIQTVRGAGYRFNQKLGSGQ